MSTPRRPAVIEPYASVRSRRGKRAVAGYFDPQVRRQLKDIAHQKDVTLQTVMEEAFNDFFKRNGFPRIGVANGPSRVGPAPKAVPAKTRLLMAPVVGNRS